MYITQLKDGGWLFHMDDNTFCQVFSDCMSEELVKIIAVNVDAEIRKEE